VSLLEALLEARRLAEPSVTPLVLDNDPPPSDMADAAEAAHAAGTADPDEALTRAGPPAPAPSKTRPSHRGGRLRHVAGQARSAAARFRHRENLMARAIEGRLADECDLVTSAYVTEPGARGRVALVSLHPDRLREWAGPTVAAVDFATLTRSAACHELVAAAVASVNSTLAADDAITALAVLGEEADLASYERGAVLHQYGDLLAAATVVTSLSEPTTPGEASGPTP
jgi:hypothetical protein